MPTRNINNDLKVNADLTVTGDVEFSGLSTTSVSPFVVSDGGTLGTRTTAQVLSDIAALPLAGGTMTGNIHFNDSVKANFGGSDSAWELEIYANSSNDAYIDKTATSVGDLIIQNQANDSDIIFKSDNGLGGLTEYLRLDGALGYTVASESIRLADGKVFYVGDDNDLGILHYSNNNYIQNNIGDLIIQNLADDKDIVFKSDDGSGGATPYLTLDGSSTGLTVSAPQGMVFFDNTKAKFGNNDDLQIYHNGSHSYIDEAGTGNLYIRNGTKNSIWCQTDGAVRLYYNDSKKLETTSQGIKITTPSSSSIGNGIVIDRPSAGTHYHALEFSTAGTCDWSIGQNAADALEIYENGSDATTRLTILEGGNVGIGTTSPAQKLDIGAGHIRLDAGYSLQWDNSHERIEQSDANLEFFVNNGQKVTINSDGIDVNGLTTANAFRSDANNTDYSLLTRNSANNAVIYVQSANTNTNQPIAFFSYGSTTVAQGSKVLVVGKDKSYFDNTNLGIGTTSPNFKLEVVGDSTSGILAVRNAANARDTFRSENAAGTRTFNIGNDASGHGIILIRNSGGTTTNYITGSGNSYFNAGNVGIGTTSPAGKLQVYTSANRHTTILGSTADLEVVSDNNTNPVALIKGTGTADLLNVFDNTTEVFTILDGGNVGIGTTSPTAKLHVSSDSGGALSEVAHFVGGGSTDDKSQISVGGNTSSALVSFGFRNTGSGFGYIANASDTEIITIDGGNERVGIGTTNPASKLHVAGTASIDTLEYNSIVSVFGQRRIKLNELSDVFYKADIRFTVTGGSANFFNGSFDSSGSLPTNTTNVININMAGQSGVPSNGITYPQGAVYISFYYTNHAYTAISLRHKSNGVYYSSTGTDVSTNSGYKVIKFPISFSNYLTDIEISITTDANLVKVAGINYLADRWTTQLELPYVSKYLTSNTVFGEFGISGTSGSAGPHLKLEGTYTTWEIENQYTGGATNDMFRIRNTATSSDSLVINRLTNHVGIGTPSPNVRTEIAASVNGNPVTSGTTQTYGALRVRGSATNVLDIGQQSASPYGMWMQVCDSTSLGTEYPLLLNPNGGNVGIGTANPDSKLDVTGGNITVNTSGITFADFKYGSIGSETSRGTITTDGVDLRINATADLVFQPTGNVGIGTNVPSAKLEVIGTGTQLASTGYYINSSFKGSSNVGVFLGHNNTNNGNGMVAGINKLAFLTYGTSWGERMVIDGSGNVGIGTTSPFSKLSINSNGAPTTSGNVASTGLTIHNGSGGTAIQIGTNDSAYSYIQSTYVNASNNLRELRFILGSQTSLRLDTSNNAHFTGNVTVGGGQILTPSGTNLALNPNTGTVSIGGVIQCSGSGMSSFTGGVNVAGALNINVGSSIHGTITSSSNSLTLNARNTGIMLFQSGGSEKMRIASSGNVGIGAGATSPSDKLTVQEDSADFSIRKTDGTLSTRIVQFGSGASEIRQYDASGSQKVSINTVGNSYFNGGNVGIGTTSPARKLHIKDNGQIKLENTGTGGWAGLDIHTSVGTNNYDMYMGMTDNEGRFFIDVNSNGDDLVILQNGNVGIGTTSPAEKLEVVNGNIQAKDSGVLAGANGAKDGFIFHDLYTSAGNYYGYKGFTSPTRLSIVTNGIEGLTIDANSNVGIGVGGTNPDARLRLKGAGGSAGFTFKTTDASNNEIFYVQDGGRVGVRYWPFSIGIPSTTSVATNAVFQVEEAGLLTVLSTGKVGIGTTSPSCKLHVENSSGTAGPEILVKNTSGSNAQILLEDNDGGAQNASITFDQASQNTLTIATGYQSSSDLNRINIAPAGNVGLTVRGGTGSNNGNVGIGTTSPSTTLDVNGITTSKTFRTNTSNTDYNVISRNSTSTTLWVQAAQSGSIQGIASFRYGSATVNQGTEVCAIRKNSSYFINTKLGVGTNNPATTLDVEGTIKHKVYTVSALPSASPAGQRAFVSDSYYNLQQSHGSGVSGGGSNFCPVYSDGSNWFNG